MSTPLNQAFHLAIDVEEYFGDFDNFLATYESLESCPRLVHSVRLFFDRTFEKHQTLQAFLHQAMQSSDSRRADVQAS